MPVCIGRCTATLLLYRGYMCRGGAYRRRAEAWRNGSLASFKRDPSRILDVGEKLKDKGFGGGTYPGHTLRGTFIRQPVRTRKKWAFFSQKSVRKASGKRQRSVREAGPRTTGLRDHGTTG